MDKILNATLRSDKPESMKKELVRRVEQASIQPQGSHVIANMFEVCLSTILESSNMFNIGCCKTVYRAWARDNRSSFKEFFTSETVQYLLDCQGANQADAIWLLALSLNLLTEPGNPRFEHLCRIVQAGAIQFVRDNIQFEVVSPFCSLLLNNHRCIPGTKNTTLFCESLISAIAVFHAPKHAKAMRGYIRDVTHVVGGLLKHIWANADQDCVLQCLKSIFKIISTVHEENLDPSLALGGIVQHIPLHYVELVTKATVTDSNIMDRNMTTALTRMVDWLSWPLAENIHVWVVAFLRELASVHKYTILINVYETKVEQVYDKLCYPVARVSSLVVLSHMLLSFQHSPQLFHKIVHKVPSTMERLEEDGEASWRIQCRLAELLHTLMTLHPGFPDLYDPVLESIKHLPVPSEETIRTRLAQSKWTSQQGITSVHISVKARSETGKAGLVNLGNTCFMNSVLQALFMCDSFRVNVVKTAPGPQEPLLVRLQQVFAFLLLTQRAAYSPSAFLHASRPPWFTAGSQQDCSEFLRYLLDQLSEQEIAGKRKQTHADDRVQRSEAGEVSTASPSLVSRTFGGLSQTTYKCLACGAESSHSEVFTDISLAFPHPETSSPRTHPGAALAGGRHPQATPPAATGTRDRGGSDRRGSAGGKVTLEQLVQHWLRPERLEGENQYHCERCGGYRDGERCMTITRAPQYLILTLLRFAYDAKTQSRSKVLTEVSYPKTLRVAVDAPGGRSQRGGDPSRRRSPPKQGRPDYDPGDLYKLCAVVIHSGLSSDAGHYYCCARHCHSERPVEAAGGGRQERPLSEDAWFLLNDSRVTASRYESFSDVTKRFAKDTPYVLIYRRVSEEEGTVATPPREPALSSHLRQMVENDNKQFLQECELQERARSARAAQAKAAHNMSAWYNGWKDDDGRGPPGSCGGGMGGGPTGPRLIF